MNSSQKRILVKIFVVVFACVSIYFSYTNLKNNEKVAQIVASVLSRASTTTQLLSDTVHDGQATSILSADVVAFTNQARLAAEPNLLPLVSNAILTRSAQSKVDDMVAKGYFEHETPEGYNVEYFIDNEGYEYITVAENLASGDFADAEALVDAWMNSPGHRANILNHDVTEIGIAVAYTEFQGRMQYVAVQHFGRPKSTCPSTDEALNRIIQTDEATLEALEKELQVLKTQIDAEGPGAGEYEAHISEYNKLVTEYNTLSEKIRNSIDTYNESVRAFNTCIASSSAVAH